MSRLADHLTGPHAGAGEQAEEARRPVFAAALLVDLRLAAELAEHHHQRVVEHPAVGEVVEQRRDARIERRQQVLLHPLEDVAVRVPVLHAAHVRLHDRHAGLDQPPREQERLAERVPAVPVAHRDRLLSMSNAFATLPEVSTESACCCWSVSFRVSALSASHFCCAFTASSSAMRSFSWSTSMPGRGAQVVDREVGRVRVARDLHEVVLRAEEAGVLAGPQERAFLKVRRQVDADGMPSGAPRKYDAARGVVRAVVALRDLVEERARLLVAGEDVVRGDEVVVLAVRQRPDDGVLVRSRRELRQVFADEQAGSLRRDGLELAANLVRRVRLRVERLEVARRAGEEDDDDRLRLLAVRQRRLILSRERATTARGRAARSSRPEASRGG